MKKEIGYYVDRKGIARIGRRLPIDQANELAREKLRRLAPVNPDTGCWEWSMTLTTMGYGCMYFRNQKWTTHRLSFSLFKGPLNGMDVCHTCDNKKCINPDHLWLGTHRQNMIDHVEKGRHYELKKTHCMRGHEFTEENTEWKSNGPGRNLARACKICQRGKFRIKAGWPPDVAYSIGPVPYGYTYDIKLQQIVPVRSRLRSLMER